MMERKKTNLCVSVDVTKKEDLLKIVDAAGPSVCLVKVSLLSVHGGNAESQRLTFTQTHIDIIEDFDEDLMVRLTELSQKHDFLIFEDHKFADIGESSFGSN